MVHSIVNLDWLLRHTNNKLIWRITTVIKWHFDAMKNPHICIQLTWTTKQTKTKTTLYFDIIYVYFMCCMNERERLYTRMCERSWRNTQKPYEIDISAHNRNRPYVSNRWKFHTQTQYSNGRSWPINWRNRYNGCWIC